MTMMQTTETHPVHVESTAQLSNRAYHRLPKRQSRWWLRDEATGEFIRLRDCRADRCFHEDLHLAPGSYMLGCGTYYNGYRETVVVAEDGSVTGTSDSYAITPDLEDDAFSRVGV